MKQENKIVTLFEAENGLWGTKDAEGNVFDEPLYERYETFDGQEYFYDEENGVECEFSPSGFVTTKLFFSNIADIFKRINMPEKYNHYIWKLLHEDFSDQDAGDRAAVKAMKVLKLSDVQMRVLQDVQAFYRTSQNIHHMSAELRINSLMPVIESERLTDDEKAMIWYGNFRVIQEFDDHFRMYEDDDNEYINWDDDDE